MVVFFFLLIVWEDVLSKKNKKNAALVGIEKRANVQLYARMIKLLFANRRDFVFSLDNESIHNAKFIKEQLERKDVKVTDRLANCLEGNRIGKLCGLLSRHGYEKVTMFEKHKNDS